MNTQPHIPTFIWRLLFAAALIAVLMMNDASAAENCGCTKAPAKVAQTYVAKPATPSWIYARSRYSHDPQTGARVAQYALKPPVEPLDDPRAVTSGFSRTRTVLRGADGSASTRFQVQSFGNNRGGINAEWERLHDAWRGATTSGGNFQGFSGFGFGGFGSFAPGFAGAGGFGPGFTGGGFTNTPNILPPGFTSVPGFGFNRGFGPGSGRPDAGRLDPDAADGFPDGRRRTPDRLFFNPFVPGSGATAPLTVP